MGVRRVAPPRALSFDLDDTLWSCHDVIERAECALYDWLRVSAPAITARHDRSTMAEQRQQLAAERPELAADLTRLRHEALRRHAREAGYAENLADEGVEVFLAERNRVELYPDVRPVLEQLRGRFTLIALTNGNACVHRTGVGDYFDLALSAADVGAPKPDPAMFVEACRRSGVRSGDLLHIGDDPLRDVHAARALGARAIWLNRAGGEWPDGLRRPDFELAELRPLPRWLAESGGAGAAAE